MIRKKFLVSILVLFSLLVIAGVSYAVSPKQQARISAEKDLPNMLKIIESNYTDFHYTSQDQVAKSYLGEPLENHTINAADFDQTKTLQQQVKPVPFYVFPVLADGRIITDLTVVLEDGKWHVVDIGGHMSTIIDKKAKENNLSLKDSYILRSGGEIFVIGKKGDAEVGYAPYFDDPDSGLLRETLASPDLLKKTLYHRKTLLLDLAKKEKKNTIGAGSSNSFLEFKQENVFKRLYNYLDYIVK